jgi:hypothetical protein
MMSRQAFSFVDATQQGEIEMVTDPVQRIRTRTYETPFDLDLHEVLGDLASLPPALDAPYLTVSLDWTPSFDNPGRRPPAEQRRSEQRNAPLGSTSQRPALTWFEAETSTLLGALDERSPQRAALEADAARVRSWLTGELDPAARGVVVVSSQAHNLFVPLVLGVTVPNRLSQAALPSLDVLAHVAEDYATYAVLTCDQAEAELMFVTQGTHEGGITLESTLFPRKQASGGLNQRRYQARADERVAAFARTIAEEVTKALRETGVDVLVLVGSETFARVLLAEFPDDVGDLVAGTVRMDIQQDPGQQAIIDAAAPFALAAERKREATAVGSIRELLGGGRAVAGAVDVINALKAGQVQTLVMNEDYAETGWADYGYPVYGAGDIPAEHPLGGEVANIVAVALQEEFVRFTLQQGGQVELVHTRVPVSAGTSASQEAGDIPRSEPATQLDEIGGVAALLRFAQ